MPTNTYVALQTVEIPSATSTITFNSIPATYTDLVVVLAYRTTNNDYISMRVNNLSSSIYSFTQMFGTGSTAGSARIASQTEATFEATPVAPGINNAIIHFQNYSNTAINKSYLLRSNDSAATVRAIVGLIQTTNAINRLDFYVAGTFAVGTTVSLYGIAAQPVPTAKATGGTITYGADGYTYHTFTSTGAFTPNQSLTCDYLVVGGGGSGGGGASGAGGAGGAGGFRTSDDASPISVTAQAYTITIGSGGPAQTLNSVGANGTASTFSSISASGGGAGGYSGNGGNGGSGGGAGPAGTNNVYYNGGTGNAGGYTPVEGYAGGQNYIYAGSTNWVAGGGGGASAVGQNGAQNADGNGGAGRTSSLSSALYGSTTRYAGGGGGGAWNSSASGSAGGLGGGGNGGKGVVVGTNGTINTGGGGGGGGQDRAGGSGGSGIVIIRYTS